MSGSLSIWLAGLEVATVYQSAARLRLAYTPAALEAYPMGTPLLSLSLPLSPEHFSHAVARSFLDGLLPEGEARRAIAEGLDIKASDTYSLVEALGRDCAGALVILPAGEAPPSLATTQSATPLTQSELDGLVANLRSAPLGISANVRLSLAGVQDKLVLTRMVDGSWALPNAAAPSTHILKPSLAAYQNTVENEAFCMRLAQHLGVSVANVETATVNNRPLIVVERFDRIVHDDGSVERIHQEDFCQALAVQTDKKYEEDGGPSLRKVAQLLDVAGLEALESLLQAVTLNVLIGNGDAHAKNFSLVHTQPGKIRLAPLYDLVSTYIYGERRLAMYIDTVQKMDSVTAVRILNEATKWGLPRARGRNIIEDMLTNAPVAASTAESDTPGVPSELLAFHRAQVAKLRDTLD
jgi:serine/threonine-protein kinase HipA